MTKRTKAVIIGNVIYVSIFILIWFVLPLIYTEITTEYKGMLSAIVTFIVSPRITKIQTQTGEKIQISWLF